MTRLLIQQLILTGVAALFTVASAYSQTLVRNVDKPGYLPYQFTMTLDAKAWSEVYLVFPSPPAGKRLVIEHTSIRLTLWSGAKGACELAGGVVGPQGYATALHVFGAPTFLYTTGAANNDFYSISEQMRFYVDTDDRAGLPLTVHCHRESNPLKPWPVTATIVGYLTDTKAQ